MELERKKNSSLYWLLISVLMLAALPSCRPKDGTCVPGEGDPSCSGGKCDSPFDSEARAGSVGTCLPFSPYPGYHTCLMSEPQNRDPATSVTPGKQTTALLYSSLPESVDHRSTIEGCIEVHSQGICGWCTAHATTAALEAMLCSSSLPYQRISEPHLWWLGKEHGEIKSCAGGWYISSAFFYLGYLTDTSTLLVRNTLWPYTTDLVQMNESKPSDADLKLYGQYGAHSAKIHPVYSKNVMALKSALAAGHNVVYSTPTFQGTGWNYWDPTFGRISDPSPAPKNTCWCDDCPLEKHCLTGYHAILIVGYDDANGGWFDFLNSWGAWWGQNGFGRISYDMISKYGNGGRYATDLEVAQVPDKPPVAVLRYNTSLPDSDDDYPFDAQNPAAELIDIDTLIYVTGQGSHDPEKEQVSYSWSVTAPDGSPAYLYSWEHSEDNVFYADQEGSYMAVLTVAEQSSAGQTASATLELKIGHPHQPDAGIADAGAPDAGVADACAPDACAPDAGVADPVVATPDANVPELP